VGGARVAASRVHTHTHRGRREGGGGGGGTPKRRERRKRGGAEGERGKKPTDGANNKKKIFYSTLIFQSLTESGVLLLQAFTTPLSNRERLITAVLNHLGFRSGY
jgi:hypothetical protein